VVADVLSFLRDLPINSLLAASTVEQLGAALGGLFQHLARLKNTKVRCAGLLDSVAHRHRRAGWFLLQ
jgi:hypothetical protein